MRIRTRGRELALHFLYQREVRGVEVDAELPAFLEGRKDPEEALRFAGDLVRAYIDHHEVVDGRIAAAAANWNLERMAFLDRNILRIAVVEMLHRDDVPPKVAINEAIEMGKRYGSARSGAFINGILDHILKDREARSPGPGGLAGAPDPTAPTPTGREDPGPERAGDVPETS